MIMGKIQVFLCKLIFFFHLKIIFYSYCNYFFELNETKFRGALFEVTIDLELKSLVSLLGVFESKFCILKILL